MHGNKWIKVWFTFITVTVLLLEVNYRFYTYNRHYVDYLVNDFIPNLKNKEYETILLGDSLAKNSFSTLNIHQNILDLTSNQAISMAGNYYLLERYIKNNKVPKKIYLFFIPEFLQNNLDQNTTYLYFETVFNKENEINEIMSIKPNLFKNNFNINKYFESRKKSIMFLNHYTPKKRLNYEEIDESSLIKKVDFINKKISSRIAKSNNYRHVMKDIPKIYLKRIIDFCKNNNIEFTVIIEPIPSEINNIFKESDWNKYLKDQNIGFYNINNIYNFNSYFFRRDGIHIDKNMNMYYQNLIDKYILDIY